MIDIGIWHHHHSLSLFPGPGQVSPHVCCAGRSRSAEGEDRRADGEDNAARDREHHPQSKRHPGHARTAAASRQLLIGSLQPLSGQPREIPAKESISSSRCVSVATDLFRSQLSDFFGSCLRDAIMFGLLRIGSDASIPRPELGTDYLWNQSKFFDLKLQFESILLPWSMQWLWLEETILFASI